MSLKWLIKSRAKWRKKLARYRHNRDKHGKGTNRWQVWNRRAVRAKRRIERRTGQIHAKEVLRERALKEARKLIGIMESGGNNRGKQVEKIIRSGGGSVGQPWCGWFVAHCYKLAGSKSVSSRWGYVYTILGYGVNRTSSPKPGDIVVFNFGHTGLYEKSISGSTIQTIEGNTGASGAVSDSATGGDGVYRKRRSRGLVRYYLHVTR